MYRRWTLLLPLVILILAAAGPARAVEDGITDQIARWDQTAARAEEAVRNGQASNKALEVLRREIVAQRAEALRVIEHGSIETRTLQAQLDALGAPPKEGESEAEILTRKRTELRDALALATEPLIAAKQAYGRAEVLVNEIDKLIRARLTTALFERGPSPVVPTHWFPAIAETSTYLAQILVEIREAVVSPAQGALVRQRAPLAAILLAVALFIVLLVQPQLARRVDARANAALTIGRSYLHMGLGLVLRLALPLIAAYLAILAVYALGISPYSSRSISSVAGLIPVVLVGSYWLGYLLFAPNVPERRIVGLDEDAARRAARLSFALGIILVVDMLHETAERDFAFSAATRSVLTALLVLAGSLCLWRLAAILGGAAPAQDAGQARGPGAGEGRDFRALVARLMQVAAVAAVVFSVVGYAQIARQAIVPVSLSLGLLGFSVAVHRVLTLISRASIGAEQEESGVVVAMLPFTIGVGVFLAALPVLAVFWGARLDEISEAWFLLTQGVEVGGTRISLGAVFVLVVVFVFGLLATNWLQGIFGTVVLPRTRLDSGARNAVLTGFGYVGVVLSALVAISAAGLDLSNLAIVAGALSVGVGFGLQAIVSNFVSGVILLIERPIKEGDWIEVSGHSGIVRKIAVRSTRIETFDLHDVIVPNSELISGTVKNMTLSTRTGRLIVPVGVAYGSDLERTREILVNAAKNQPMVITDPEPIVLFTGLGDSSLDFELRCYLRDIYSVLSVKSDLLFEIYRELGEAGIEIPFPQRDVSLRNVDEIARAVASRRPAAEGGTSPE